MSITTASSCDTLNQSFHDADDDDVRPSLNESTLSEDSFFSFLRPKSKKQLKELVVEYKQEVKMLKKEKLKLMEDTVQISMRHMQEKKALESELGSKAETIVRLEEQLQSRSSTSQEFHNFQKDLDKQKKQSDTLLLAYQCKFETQEKEIAALKDDVVCKQLDNESLRAENVKLINDIEASDRTIGLLQDDLSRLQQQLTTPVPPKKNDLSYSSAASKACSSSQQTTEDRLRALEQAVAQLTGKVATAPNKKETTAAKPPSGKRKTPKRKTNNTAANKTSKSSENKKNKTIDPPKNRQKDDPKPTPRTSLQKNSPATPAMPSTTTKSTLVIGDSTIKHVVPMIRDASTAVLCWPGIKLDEVARRLATVKTEPESAIVFSVGLSDVKSAETPGEVSNKIDKLILAAKKRFPNRKIVINGAMNRLDQEPEFLTILNIELKTVCEKRKITFLDPNVCIKPTHLAKDGIHLNRQGSQVFGNFFSGVKQVVLGN